MSELSVSRSTCLTSPIDWILHFGTFVISIKNFQIDVTVGWFYTLIILLGLRQVRLWFLIFAQLMILGVIFISLLKLHCLPQASLGLIMIDRSGIVSLTSTVHLDGGFTSVLIAWIASIVSVGWTRHLYIIIDHVLNVDITPLCLTLIVSIWSASMSLLPAVSSSVLFQSFELFISVSQVLVFRFITALFGLKSLSIQFSDLLEAIRTLTQVLLKESYWRVIGQINLMVLRHGFSYSSGILPVVDHLLLKVQQLSLEARVGINHATPRFDEAHCLEETPILLMHQVCNHTRCWSALPGVTVEK